MIENYSKLYQIVSKIQSREDHVSQEFVDFHTVLIFKQLNHTINKID